uniref:Uncharacterized protein n=1 Tax=viral metagenome TaxID=1070528 RepID=A0A6C0BUM8_9ZZZZ
METKEQLVNTIKEWVSIDNRMRELSKQQKILRENKKEITKSLVEVMKSNEIDCFDINDGQLMYSQTKTKAPLNKKNISTILLSYFGDNKIEQIEDLTRHLLENREEKIRENVRRKIDKKK